MRYDKDLLNMMCKFHLIPKRKMIAALNVIFIDMKCDEELAVIYLFLWRMVVKNKTTIDNFIIVCKMLLKHGVRLDVRTVEHFSSTMFNQGYECIQIANQIELYSK